MVIASLLHSEGLEFNPRISHLFLLRGAMDKRAPLASSSSSRTSAASTASTASTARKPALAPAGAAKISDKLTPKTVDPVCLLIQSCPRSLTLTHPQFKSSVKHKTPFGAAYARGEIPCRCCGLHLHFVTVDCQLCFLQAHARVREAQAAVALTTRHIPGRSAATALC